MLFRRLLAAKNPRLEEYKTNYLTFIALENNFCAKNNIYDIEYCINASGNWTTLTANTWTPAISSGQIISFRANISPYEAGCGTFIANAMFEACGKPFSLVDESMFQVYGESVPYGYSKLFMDNTYLKKVHSGFLSGIANVHEHCYEYMFNGCTGLTSVPSDLLPVTQLADRCYLAMFYGCSSLTTAPALPATSLAEGCYSLMFVNCSKLSSVPALPATELKPRCYHSMFGRCTSLKSIPSGLLSSGLAIQCYSQMFNGCTGLTSIPSGLLPATELTSSTSVSQNSGCYEYMFADCTGLTSVPSDLLPATTLTSGCYEGMFEGCINLTKAPDLLATGYWESCYAHMFSGCTKLNYIKMLLRYSGSYYFGEPYFDTILTDWVSGVASTGTFIKHTNNTWIETNSTSGIPSGWTVQTATS